MVRSAIGCHIHTCASKEGDGLSMEFLLGDQPSLGCIWEVAKSRACGNYSVPPVAQMCDFPHSSSIVCIPYLLAVSFQFLMSRMVAREYMGMASGSPWVVPSWENSVTIHEELSGGSVAVNQDGGERWAQPLDIVKGNLSVQGVESVAGTLVQNINFLYGRSVGLV